MNPFRKVGQILKRAWSIGSDDVLQAFGVSPTQSGVDVNDESALSIAAFFCGVRLLSETMGSLPLQVYRRTKNGKERATEHPLYNILHSAPNPEMCSMSFVESLMFWRCMRGGGHAEIVTSGDGRVKYLWPIPANRIVRERYKKKIIYRVRTAAGGERVLFDDEVLHIPWFTSNGLDGLSPIGYNRETLGVNIAQQQFAARTYGQGSFLGLVLQRKGRISETEIDRVKVALKERHEGVGNARRSFVLPEGMEIINDKLALPPEDLQYIQSRKFSVADIARILNIPPHKLKEMDRATFSNIEHQSIEFVTDSMRPHAVKFEQEMMRKLLSVEERKDYFIEFNMDGLMRGDTLNRYNAYRVASQPGGWMARNEIRAIENLNRIDGLDAVLEPLNSAAAPSKTKPATKDDDK